MAATSDPDETAPLSAEALSEWGMHVDSVLRGIAHALNNRATALSAVLELARDVDSESRTTTNILGSELERVAELVRVVRTIGAPRAGIEAFSPADAAAEALEVLKLHADHRERQVTVDASRATPVRVPRWMYVRALIALGARASSVSVQENGDWVVASAERDGGAATGDSPLMRELAALMGGDELDAACGFRVPALAALRRREAL